MENEKIINPYVSIEINENSLSSISKSISEFLDDFGIPYKASPRAHISLAYILGPQEKKYLEELVEELIEDRFTIKVIGITLLDGKITGKNYIALELESDSDFAYAHEFICENCEVSKIGDKFVAHVTLFELENGVIPKESWYDFCRVLEVFSNDFISGKTLSGESISVFNQNREKEIEKKIPSSKKKF